ncbi:hypothetical protein [Pedobacter ginsengisoli]|nr:hypothetical protein [Pedobacter ginsengisoli]
MQGPQSSAPGDCFVPRNDGRGDEQRRDQDRAMRSGVIRAG